MLHKVTQWRGAAVSARDGDVGKIEDVYFDDQHLTVRYLVVDTGTWLEARRVLISPYSVRISSTTAPKGRQMSAAPTVMSRTS